MDHWQGRFPGCYRCGAFDCSGFKVNKIDAENGKIRLKLEVKGVATDVVSVHITSNEYDNMMKDKKHYRLCVVVNAVRNPQMVVFVWDESLRQWVSEVDSTMVLDIDMKPSYIASVK